MREIIGQITFTEIMQTLAPAFYVMGLMFALFIVLAVLSIIFRKDVREEVKELLKAFACNVVKATRFLFF